MFCSIQNEHEVVGKASLCSRWWRPSEAPIDSKQIEHDFDIISLTSHLEIQNSIDALE